MTVERGYDPRDFVVYAFGGGGPIHAVGYARELGCRTIVIPLGTVASTWSALGIQAANVLHIYEKSEPMTAPFDHQRLNAIFEELEERGRRQLRDDGIDEKDFHFDRFADMKFTLQIHNVEVPVPALELTADSMEPLMRSFVDKYETLYGEGSAFTGAGMEIGNLRVRAVGKIGSPGISRRPQSEPDARVGCRDVYWVDSRTFEKTAIYDGNRLSSTMTIEAPAIIEMPETTIVLQRGSRGQLDDYGNFVISLL